MGCELKVDGGVMPGGYLFLRIGLDILPAVKTLAGEENSFCALLHNATVLFYTSPINMYD